jgi:hypothetical protein
MLPDFQALDVFITQDIEEIKNKKFDVAHVHHNINAYEIRYYFPNLPIIYMSHGILPFLEQPPVIELGISKFLAVSEEVKENLLNKGIPEKDIIIFRNIVDEHKFCEWDKINSVPKRALILSNRIDVEKEKIIKEACNKLNIECIFIGKRFHKIPYSEVPKYINEVDIVFSVGRGVIEAMLCGRIPIIFDYMGGDGMVTPYNFEELIKHNFSGRRFAIEFTVDQLIYEIEKYDIKYSEALRMKALHYFGAEKNIDILIKIYKEAIEGEIKKVDESQKKLLHAFVHTVNETRTATFHILKRDYIIKLQKENEEKSKHIKKLDEELKEKGDYIRKLQGEIEERNRHIKKLDEELKEKGKIINLARRKFQDKNIILDAGSYHGVMDVIKYIKNEINPFSEFELLIRPVDIEKYRNNPLFSRIHIVPQGNSNRLRLLFELRRNKYKRAFVVIDSSPARNKFMVFGSLLGTSEMYIWDGKKPIYRVGKILSIFTSLSSVPISGLAVLPILMKKVFEFAALPFKFLYLLFYYFITSIRK